MNYKKAYKYLQKDLKDIIDYNGDFPLSKSKYINSIVDRILFQTKIYENMIDKPVTITNHKLKGWDWHELADKLNIPTYDPETDEMGYIEVDDVLSYKKIYNYLEDNFDNKQVIEVIREHLKKLIEQEGSEGNHYDAVWSGMLNIKSNYVFMQFVLALLGHMWT